MLAILTNCGNIGPFSEHSYSHCLLPYGCLTCLLLLNRFDILCLLYFVYWFPNSRKTLEELIPLIVNDDVTLNRVNWCYTHQKNCMRGPVLPSNSNDELNTALMGSPCTVARWNLCFDISVEVKSGGKFWKIYRPKHILNTQIAHMLLMTQDYSLWGDRLGECGVTTTAFLVMLPACTPRHILTCSQSHTQYILFTSVRVFDFWNQKRFGRGLNGFEIANSIWYFMKMWKSFPIKRWRKL